MQKTEINKPSKMSVVLSMMLSPANVLKSAISGIPWFFSVLISASAFCLFFLQTGLDLYKTGQKEMGFVILSAIAGAGYGLLVIPLLAVIIWGILKLTKSDKDLKWIVSSFCLSYSGALIYGVIGIVFSVMLEWKTSVAFGVTGVLWAIGPMIITIRATTDGKNAMSIPIATIVSIIVLLSWSLFGQL